MIKSWQIFVFSVIPLVLVLAGVIVGSIHFSGGDSRAEVFPTARPQSSAPPPTPVPGASNIALKAANLLFDKAALSATAGTIVVTLDNTEAVVHNVAFYTNAQMTAPMSDGSGGQFKTPVETGPIVDTKAASGVSAGLYYFKCEAHPDTMKGSLTVR